MPATSSWTSSMSQSCKLTATMSRRFDFTIKPCHLVAFLFHPKYLGARLTLEQIETVKEWLICKDEAFLPAAITFQAEATPFPASFFNTITWLKALGSWTGLPDGFNRLHGSATVCSGIILQRIFSSIELVLIKLRNKLGLQRATKVGVHLQDIERTQTAGLLVWAGHSEY